LKDIQKARGTTAQDPFKEFKKVWLLGSKILKRMAAEDLLQKIEFVSGDTQIDSILCLS